MTIESNQGAGLGRSTATHSAGKPGGGLHIGSGVDTSGFSGVMGSLFAAEETRLADLPDVSWDAAPPGGQPVLSLTPADAAIQDASLDAVNPMTDWVAQAQGGTVMSFATSTWVAQSVGVADLGKVTDSVRIGDVAAFPVQSSRSVVKASATLVSPGSVNEPSDGISPKMAVATALKDGFSELTVLPTNASDRASAQTVDASTGLTSLMADRQRAALIRHDVLSTPVQETVQTSRASVWLVSTGTPLAEPFLQVSRGKVQTSHLGGIELGLGAHQVLDRLGLSVGQEVMQTNAAVADTQIAETVSYWVTQGVQNAELTLDGLGDEPVEVHIELEGNQTRVDFRTDQPQVRQALEAANAQLKSLLLSQGLELSGMSVGSFAQGGQSSDPKGSKPPSTRSIGLRLVDRVSAASTPVIGSSVGQALDLYV